MEKKLDDLRVSPAVIQLESSQDEDNEVECHGVDEHGRQDVRLGRDDDTSAARNPLRLDNDTYASKVSASCTEQLQVVDVPCKMRVQWPRMRIVKGMTMYSACPQMAMLEWKSGVRSDSNDNNLKADSRSDRQVDTGQSNGSISGKLWRKCKRPK